MLWRIYRVPRRVRWSAQGHTAVTKAQTQTTGLTRLHCQCSESFSQTCREVAELGLVLGSEYPLLSAHVRPRLLWVSQTSALLFLHFLLLSFEKEQSIINRKVKTSWQSAKYDLQFYFGRGLHSVMLLTHSWLCTQKSLPGVLWGLYVVPGIQLGLAVVKASSLPAVLLLCTHIYIQTFFFFISENSSEQTFSFCIDSSSSLYSVMT